MRKDRDRVAKSEVLVDVDEEARRATAISPRLVLDGLTPRLIDQGNWYAFEAKRGTGQIDSVAATLLKFRDRMVTLRYQTTNITQQFRRQQRNIVHNLLVLVAGLVKRAAVHHHLAQVREVVGKIVEPVEIAVQPLLQNLQNQDLPYIHARTIDRLINAWLKVCFKLGKQFFAGLLVHMKMLQSAKFSKPQYTVTPQRNAYLN